MPLCRNPNWWKRRSILERTLLLLISASLIAIGLLTFMLVNLLSAAHQRNVGTYNDIKANGAGESSSSAATVCLAPQCVHSASSILEKIDTTVDPCDDFYDFACGTFIKTTYIPDDKSSVNMFSLIEDELSNQLNGLLSTDLDAGEIKPFLLAKYMYQSCITIGEIERSAHKTIKSIISRLGGWPVLGNWNESLTWEDINHRSAEHGFPPHYLLAFAVASDWMNSSRRILDVGRFEFLN